MPFGLYAPARHDTLCLTLFFLCRKTIMPYYPQEPKDPKKEPQPKAHSVFRPALFCLSALLIVYGAVRLIGYGADWSASRRTARELREIAAEAEETQEPVPEITAVPSAPEPTAVPSPEPTGVPAEKPSALPEELPAVNYPGGLQVSARIRTLRKKSEYIIGWLTVDTLDEPVVQKDNVFFLDHDAAGRRNSNGAVFLDEDTPLITRPYTFLLYGHNMKTGAMFGSLRKYEQRSYFNDHRIIRFDTLYEKGQYAVFAVATIRLTPGTAGYVSLSDLRSSRRSVRRKALNALTALSVHPCILDVSEEDQLLLLITCVGDDDQRLVVAARRLREKETPDTLVLKKPDSL